jgi:hypothetical protein
MSPPHDLSHDDQQLIDYLLHLLPPDETARLDETAIVDDDVAERLRIVEHDLVDAYVRGGLSGRTLTRFESHYLASPRRREHVMFAKSFVRSVDRAAAAAEVARPTPAPTAVPKRSLPWLVWSLAATVALLAMASSALLMQTLRLGRGLAVVQNEHVTLEGRTRSLEQQLAAARAANADATGEIQRLRDAAGSAARNAASVALVLLPQTRAIGPVPTAALAAGTERVAFELRLESTDFASYQVALKDPAVNRILWRSSWIAATASRGQPSVVVSVPARIMKPQHYALDVAGRGPGGATEMVGTYVFEVVPR